jgi:hypothetical protein
MALAKHEFKFKAHKTPSNNGLAVSHASPGSRLPAATRFASTTLLLQKAHSRPEGYNWL